MFDLQAGIKEEYGVTSVPSEISVVADTVQISKEKLQDLEWELRAWRECFPALKYNQEIFKIEERGNVKEGTIRQERID